MVEGLLRLFSVVVFADYPSGVRWVVRCGVFCGGRSYWYPEEFCECELALMYFANVRDFMWYGRELDGAHLMWAGLYNGGLFAFVVCQSIC